MQGTWPPHWDDTGHRATPCPSAQRKQEAAPGCLHHQGFLSKDQPSCCWYEKGTLSHLGNPSVFLSPKIQHIPRVLLPGVLSKTRTEPGRCRGILSHITLLLGDNNNSNNRIAIPQLLILPVCSISSLQLLWINRSISISPHLSTSHLSIGPADPSRHTEPRQHLMSRKRCLWVRCCSPSLAEKVTLSLSFIQDIHTHTRVHALDFAACVMSSFQWLGTGRQRFFLSPKCDCPECGHATAPGAHCVIPARPSSALGSPRCIGCPGSG